MATYVNNLRLKEITTGDEDGTWGTSTNTNLELITDGFSFGTKEMAADANETFTMPDATADATRSLYLKITSAVSLTATREVTLGPNTISKVWMIENATSGSQIITIRQDSGATVDVPNGSKVMVVTDGAGAGAAVFNANPTELDSVALSSVLATGNTTGGTDLAVSTGDDITFADSSKAIFGAGNDLQIYHDGSGSYVDDQGTGPLYLRANRIDAVNLSDAAMFTAIGGNAVQLYYNGNEKLATTATGIDVTGEAVMDGLTVDGAAAFASNNILVSIQDTNAGGSGGIQFKQSTGAEVGRISFNDGEDLRFFTGSAVTERLNIDGGTGDISFYEDTGTTAKLFWDASAESLGIGTTSPARKLAVNSGGIQVAAVFESTSTNSTRISLVDANTTGDNYVSVASSGNDLALYAGAAEKMRIDSAGNVGIGTSSPSQILHVADSGNAVILIEAGNTSGSYINFADTDDTNVGQIQYDHSSNFMAFRANDSERMRIDSSGNVGIGVISPTEKLDVSGTVKATNYTETVYALTGTALDAGNGGIQTKTLAANTTFTDSLASGESITLQLEAGASYTVTWPTMQWVTSGGNVAPTLTAKDTLVFWKVSSTLYGAYTGSYV